LRDYIGVRRGVGGSGDEVINENVTGARDLSGLELLALRDLG
jgi:hypothetical protein